MKKLAIVSKDPAFSNLIVGLKKRGINVERADLGQHLNQYDTLLLDLSYPLEQAYTFLQDAKENYQYSETVVLAIVSHKSHLTKLRSFALGVDGYLSPKVQVDELLERIRVAHDPERHLPSKIFDSVEMSISTEGSLTHITEGGAVIKSRIAFEPGSKFRLSSQLFSDLMIDKSLRCSISKSNPMPKRGFVAEVDFLNISDSDRDRIRQMIKSWGVN